MLCTQSQPLMTGELVCHGKPHDAIVSLQRLHRDHLLYRASGPEPKAEGKLL
jgi:hypothetical protein